MGCCAGAWPQGLPVGLPLSVLVLQTTMPLLIRHSRRPVGEGGARVQYNPASVTLLAEIVKCVVAFGFMYRAALLQRQRGGVGGVGGGSRRHALVEAGQRFVSAMWRLSALLLPAMLYFASNVMAMHALGHLRSYIFTAIMNSRIVFAAILSMLLLNKSVSAEQWRAIAIIFCAATVLCLEDVQTGQGGYTMTEESMGMIIALGAATVSAAGGVLVEKYLNNPTTLSRSVMPVAAAPSSSSSSSSLSSAHPPAASSSAPIDAASQHPQQQQQQQQAAASSASMLWEQQGVLALFSAGFADLYVLLFHGDAIRERRLLEGWTSMTVLIMLMQAVQGILVAMTIQRCGIVFRLILGTISICLCILFEGLLFFEPVVFREVLSIVMVIIGSNMYSTASARTCICPIHGAAAPPLAAAGGAATKADVVGGGMHAHGAGVTRRRHSPTPLDD